MERFEGKLASYSSEVNWQQSGACVCNPVIHIHNYPSSLTQRVRYLIYVLMLKSGWLSRYSYRLQDARSGIDSRHRKVLLISTVLRLILGPKNSLICGVSGVISPRITRQERKAGHSAQSSAEVTNGGVIPPFPYTLTSLCLIKHRAYFKALYIYVELVSIRNYFHGLFIHSRLIFLYEFSSDGGGYEAPCLLG